MANSLPRSTCLPMALSIDCGARDRLWGPRLASRVLQIFEIEIVRLSTGSSI